MTRLITYSVLPLTLLTIACKGEPAPMETMEEPLEASGAALDAHTHIMSPALAAAYGVPPEAPPADAEDLVSLLDEANVEQAIVLSLAYLGELPDDESMMAENDYTAAEVGTYPDRLIGFCGIHPLRPFAMDEIDRCVDDLGMTGVKLQLASSDVDLRVPEHVETVSAVLDKISERDVPVLMHASSADGLPLDPDAVINLAFLLGTHPDVRVTLAHCASGSNFDLDTLTGLLAAFESSPPMLSPDSLWLDTSGCFNFYSDAPLAEKEQIVWRLRKWGMDHVLFGSDYLSVSPQATPSEALEVIGSFPFTQEELDTILDNDGSDWLRGN